MGNVLTDNEKVKKIDIVDLLTILKKKPATLKYQNVPEEFVWIIMDIYFNYLTVEYS